MIQLNGKCKEKFLEWYWNEWFDDKERNYYEEKEIAVKALYTTDTVFLNALIIEFFDYKNIFIEVSGIFYQGFEPEFNYNIQEKGTLNGINGEVFNSRQEATIQAIKKANEIYNERFK